eukprot:gene18310-biopygen873
MCPVPDHLKLELIRGARISHASREFAPRCEPHPARAKWNPMIRMNSGRSLAFQRLSRAPLQFILSVRLLSSGNKDAHSYTSGCMVRKISWIP